MKLCIAGKNNIAVDCLIHALNYFDINDICVVLSKQDDMLNSWQKSLGFYAKMNKIQVLQLEEVQEIEDIIFISLQFDRIIKPSLFKTKRLYNIHFSLLPEYKGVYTSILPILHGKQFSGVTFHHIDSCIDTGDIIFQEKIDITGLNSQELYFEYLKVGTNLIRKNFQAIIDASFESFPQPFYNSTYFSKKSISLKDVQINLNQTAWQVCQFVKAFSFRIYQMPIFNTFQIYKCLKTNERSCLKPGNIIEENGQFFKVSTIDFNILLFKDYLPDLIKYCKEGCRIDFKLLDYIEDVDCIDKNGWTPLIIASYNGNVEAVEYLHKRGADVNKTNLNGTTPLMYAKDYALKNSDDRVFNFLLENGANIYVRDIYGKSLRQYIDVNSYLYKKYFND